MKFAKSFFILIGFSANSFASEPVVLKNKELWDTNTFTQCLISAAAKFENDTATGLVSILKDDQDPQTASLFFVTTRNNPRVVNLHSLDSKAGWQLNGTALFSTEVSSVAEYYVHEPKTLIGEVDLSGCQ